MSNFQRENCCIVESFLHLAQCTLVGSYLVALKVETDVYEMHSCTLSHAKNGNLNIIAVSTSIVYVSFPVLCAALIGINPVTWSAYKVCTTGEQFARSMSNQVPDISDMSLNTCFSVWTLYDPHPSQDGAPKLPQQLILAACSCPQSRLLFSLIRLCSVPSNLLNNDFGQSKSDRCKVRTQRNGSAPSCMFQLCFRFMGWVPTGIGVGAYRNNFRTYRQVLGTFIFTWRAY